MDFGEYAKVSMDLSEFWVQMLSTSSFTVPKQESYGNGLLLVWNSMGAKLFSKNDPSKLVWILHSEHGELLFAVCFGLVGKRDQRSFVKVEHLNQVIKKCLLFVIFWSGLDGVSRKCLCQW